MSDTERGNHEPSPNPDGLSGDGGACGSETRFTRRLLTILFVVAGAAVCVLALRLLCVIFAGLLLGVFLQRISRAIQRRTSVSYRVAFAITVAVLMLSVSAAGFFLIPRLGDQLNNLSSKLSSSVQSLLTRMSEWGWVESVTEKAPQIGGDVLGTMDAAALMGGAFSSLMGAVVAVFLILFIGFYLAIDPGLYRRMVLSLVRPPQRRQAAGVLRSSLDTLWWWTLGRLVAMTIVGVATAVGLLLLGVPLAITLGAVAGVVSFVPTIGAALAILPALLVAFEQGPLTAVYVLALYAGIQAVENNVITPIVQQKAVSIPPVLLIVSQVLMGLLVGFVGVAIATPLTALGLELVRELVIRDRSVNDVL